MNVVRPAFTVMTWGCQMNEDDSAQMANLLRQMGYEHTADPSDADVILLNTCAVREKPEQKVLSKLGELKPYKEQNPGLIIGVCGCMAQRAGRKIRSSAPHVDMIIGTDGIQEIPDLIRRVKAGERPVFALALPEKRNGHSYVAEPRRVVGEVGLKQFVPIMYGCDNFCSYCVVPYARGRERSRPVDDVVAEVTELVAHGCREVTLLGQNVNSYRPGSSQQSAVPDFAYLLERLSEIEGLMRIRFTTSHPKDLSDRLIDAIARLPKVCEHLHLPIQAGDNDVLQGMKRGYTVEHYMRLVGKVRAAVPNIAITTDVMVGFPGETEEQFRNTLHTVETIRYDGAFMFAFNPRPNTAAVHLSGQLDSRTKQHRLQELIDLQNRISLEKIERQVGTVFEVLVEGPSEKDASKLTGYTRQNKTMVFEGPPELIGKLAMVRAATAHPWGFTGEPA